MLEKQIQIYKETRKKIIAYQYYDWVVGWDQETEAPKGAQNYRLQQMEVMANETYKVSSDEQYMNAIEYLHENLNDLSDEDFKTEVKKVYKDLRFIKKIPKEEYIDYQVLIASGPQIWAEAKQKNDFSIFEPTLEKIVQYNRKIVKYLETDDLKGYDVLLDLYEEGMTVKKYDHFFELIKTELVPFVMTVTKNNKEKFNRKLTKGIYPKLEQEKFSKYLLEVFNFDLDHGVLKESEHPFTSNVSNQDVRITTRYHEDILISSIFSTIHELGHALYEMQTDSKYNDTFLRGGSSLGIHESQSRLYENMIGRSFIFWEQHYKQLVNLFPKQLKGISVTEFYKFVNQAKRSLIRIEADELTYPLHVLVRYEIEKSLINGKLKVKDLPRKWRLLMSKYVGKRPITDKEGVLQDIHWSFGSIGYFPTYALGSAYAAQLYHFMNEEINVEQAIENNNISLINDWLKEHIHKHAQSKTPQELMLIATKEPFNPKYYMDYLKKKFGTPNA